MMDREIVGYLIRLLTIDRATVSRMGAEGFTDEDTGIVRAEVARLEEILKNLDPES